MLAAPRRYGPVMTQAPADVRLRPATEDDVDFLTDVVVTATRAQGRWPDDADEDEWRTGFAEWTREQVRGEVSGSTTSVIEVGGLPAGRHRVVRSGDHVELAGIQLRPEFQGRGIGSALVGALTDDARVTGTPVRLSVERDNPRARALYERLGFVLVGEDDRDHHLLWDPAAEAP